MPRYRGNIGNLLQHWVLCELLQRSNAYWTEIRFVDAYSMAPFATERHKSGWSAHLFDHARDRATSESAYEQTWRQLAAVGAGYPNSAVFLAALWRGTYSFLLCEWDEVTVAELRAWKHRQQSEPSCVDVEIAPGDWRRRFQHNVSQSDQLTLMSFDPDMFNRHGSDDGRKMTPADLELVGAAVTQIPGAVVLQLSTYDVNNNNSQRDVEPAVVSGLQRAGLKQLAVVRTDGQMMSLVFSRFSNPSLGDDLSALPVRFDSWLRRLKASASTVTQPALVGSCWNVAATSAVAARPPRVSRKR